MAIPVPARQLHANAWRDNFLKGFRDPDDGSPYTPVAPSGFPLDSGNKTHMARWTLVAGELVQDLENPWTKQEIENSTNGAGLVEYEIENSGDRYGGASQGNSYNVDWKRREAYDMLVSVKARVPLYAKNKPGSTARIVSLMGEVERVGRLDYVSLDGAIELHFATENSIGWSKVSTHDSWAQGIVYLRFHAINNNALLNPI